MSILTLFFILFLIFIVPKIVRAYLIVHRIRGQARKVYEQMYGGAAGADASRPKSRKPGWSAPVPRRKKIDPSVGEYVKFQEIATTETVSQTTDTATGSTTTTVSVEQQVTDAEWEEI